MGVTTAADSAATSGAAAPSIALVALVSDFVCGGGIGKLRQVEKNGVEARGQLREHLQQSFTAQRALLQEAFLWESSPASLEHVGRSSEFFSSFRAVVAAPLAESANTAPIAGDEPNPPNSTGASAAPNAKRSRKPVPAYSGPYTPPKPAPKTSAKKARRSGKSAKTGHRRANAAPRVPRGRPARKAAAEEVGSAGCGMSGSEGGSLRSEEEGAGADSDSDSASLMSVSSEEGGGEEGAVACDTV